MLLLHVLHSFLAFEPEPFNGRISFLFDMFLDSCCHLLEELLFELLLVLRRVH